MTTEFELTKEDLIAFNCYHNFHSPTGRRQYLRAWFIPAIVWLVVCGGIWSLADADRGTPGRTFLDMLPLFSGIPLYLMVFPWLYRRKVRKLITGMTGEGHNRGLFGHHRIEITPQGITDASDLRQRTSAWQAVERVIKDGDYLYVYDTALSAVIVPRRAFATAAEFDAFVKTVKSFHEMNMA